MQLLDEMFELPGPDGPPISRIPNLLPEQKTCSKDNINLNYVSITQCQPTLCHISRARKLKY